MTAGDIRAKFTACGGDAATAALILDPNPAIRTGLRAVARGLALTPMPRKS